MAKARIAKILTVTAIAGMALTALPGTALAVGTTGTTIDTTNLVVAVGHCEEEDVSRNGARTAQLTGAAEATGPVASVSIRCVVRKGTTNYLDTHLSLPGNTAVAPTVTGTVPDGFIVCGYGTYVPVLTSAPKKIDFQNVDACP